MSGFRRRLILGPDDIDLSRSPLAGHFDAETYVLGAFNPALTRLPNGNLAIFVRVAEALRQPIFDGISTRSAGRPATASLLTKAGSCSTPGRSSLSTRPIRASS
jgi:hypothetical protein